MSAEIHQNNNSHKRSRDHCSDKKECDNNFPIIAPPGPPGNEGIPGIPRQGSIIPYGSGTFFIQPSIGAGANSFVLSTLSFAHHHEFLDINTALSESQDVFIMPRDGRIRSLFLSVFIDQENVIDIDEVYAELWKSTNGGNTYEKFLFPIKTQDNDTSNLPYLTSNVKLLVPEFVSEGTHLILIVLYVYKVEGVTVKDVKVAFRAGLDIE